MFWNTSEIKWAIIQGGVVSMLNEPVKYFNFLFKDD